MRGGRDIELRILYDKDLPRTYKILFDCYLLEGDGKPSRVHLPRKSSCHVTYFMAGDRFR